MMGMGLYKNMNVMDAFGCVVHQGRQHNIRASRPLRPDFSTAVGPIRFEVIEPYKRLRFAIAPNEHEVALDLEWTSQLMPFLEGRWGGNAKMLNGRIAIDTQRFGGIGRWNGHIQLGARRFEVRDWFGGRDHSWGVRSGVGGYEPVNGPSELDKGAGFFLGYFVYGNDETAGYTIWTEDGDGNFDSLEGALRWHPSIGRPDARLVGIAQEVEFAPDSRHYTRAAFVLRTDDGKTRRVECIPALPGTVLKGYGGHGEGYFDKKGFGVYRGQLVECDVYDLSAADMRQLPVEQPLNVSIDGTPGYWGWGTVIATGELARYELRRQTLEELKRYNIFTDNISTD
jgi:hypothetical protein